MRLASDRRLVHKRVSTGYQAINGDTGSWLHNHGITDLDLTDTDLLRPAVTANDSLMWKEIQQLFDGLPALSQPSDPPALRRPARESTITRAVKNSPIVRAATKRWSWTVPSSSGERQRPRWLLGRWGSPLPRWPLRRSRRSWQNSPRGATNSPPRQPPQSRSERVNPIQRGVVVLPRDLR